jgi:DNA mismatch repair protein MutL
MAKINLLDPSVFNMIAAGEVVERPASVVKELVENSIDAGATRIDVTIIDGGLKRIQVSDDGIGIEKDDVRSAFLPHATSKLEHIRDLDTLSSLGFRGEALASIASVSEVTLISRAQSEDVASYIYLVAGKVVDERVDSRAKGTVITVENLFFNTPARLKFMKSNSAEQKAILSMIEKIVFANPAVSITVSDGKGLLFEHEAGDLANAVCSVWGADSLEKMIPVEYEKAGISVKGYVSKVEYSKPTRAWQAYVVNGRAVENKDIVLAVDRAHEGRLVKHNYPFCVLEILLPFDEVDINVHPRKSEVRFRNKSAVFSAIYHGLGQAFDRDNPYTNTSFIRDESASYGEIVLGHSSSAADFGYRITNPNYQEEPKKEEVEQTRLDTSSLYEIARSRMMQDKPYYPSMEGRHHIIGDLDDINDRYDDYGYHRFDLENALNISRKGMFDGNIVGQVFDTYLIVERDGYIYIIDQHAAHERILYNRLIERLDPKYIQSLLIPYTIKLAGAEEEYFEKILPTLESIGFEIEKKFDKYFIYAVPDVVVDMDFKKFFAELFKNMLTDKEITILDIVKEKMCRMACRSAIKGGDRLNSQQIQDTVMSLLDEDGKLPDKCPHGRPAVVRMSQSDVEKMFKRIV